MSDPLSQLLSEHQNETTILDQHFKKSIAPKIEKNNAMLHHNNDSTNKQDGNEKSDEENDQPIGLVHRQPSYTSLHGNLIGKDGVKVDKLPDLTEEGEETKVYHQDLDKNEPKPTKPFKKSQNNINSNNSYLSQDNVIAFDEHDDSEDVPIGLTYRQPSFSSMGDHLISKGGDSLADIVPLKTIPIEEAIIEENIEEEARNEAENENEDEEEEENPQVQIVKDLKQKNKDRWQKMGYEPPPNLIQLTRAQSQSVFNQNQVFMQQPQTMSPLLFGPVQEEDETPNTNNLQYHVPTNQTSNNKTTPNSNSPDTNRPKIAHRRCGSNGMKLGEASTSLARMSQALMIYDSNSKLPDENSDNENEYDNEEEEAAENELEEEEEENDSNKNNSAEKEVKNNKDKKDTEEENKRHKEKKHKNKDKKRFRSKKHSKGKHDSEPNSYPIRDLNEKKRSYLFPSSSSSYDSESEDNGYYYYQHNNDELFGKLGQIVKEDQSSDVYNAILTGKLPKSSDNYQIKLRIQQYINTCINNLWVDETEYLSKIIDGSNKYHHSHHQKENDNYRFAPHRQKHMSHSHHHHHHRKTKGSSIVEKLKSKAAEEDLAFESKIQETLLKQQHMLDMLNEEYKEAANDLDARYAIESRRNNENEFNSKWSPSPAVLELKSAIKRLLKARNYTAVQELSSKLKKLELEEEAEVNEMIHDHYINADRLLKEHFAMRRALLLNNIQFELQTISEERQITARRYSKSISRLRNLDLELRDFGSDDYDDDNDNDYDDYSNDVDSDRFPQRISRENDEKIIELMAEKMMDLRPSSSEDEYDDDYEKPKKKKKDKKNKDKKKDKKKKDKKKEKRKKDKKYD